MLFLRAKTYKKLAALAAVAVLLGQLALVLHEIIAHSDYYHAHESEHGHEQEQEISCEICVVLDRVSYFAASFGPVSAFLWLSFLLCLPTMQFAPIQRHQTAQPRAPPAR